MTSAEEHTKLLKESGNYRKEKVKYKDVFLMTSNCSYEPIIFQPISFPEKWAKYEFSRIT